MTISKSKLTSILMIAVPVCVLVTIGLIHSALATFLALGVIASALLITLGACRLLDL